MAIIGLWLWLYRPVFSYFAMIFGQEDARTNLIILAGALALIALRVRQAGTRPRPDAAPCLHLPALLLSGGGSVLYLAVERFLDINVASALLFGLASYGLLGLWLQPRAWRQGFPAVLLLLGALPFGDWMQVFIGYPMRILTATLVRDGLASFGVGTLGVDTILVFENSVSQVDLPCSGVKSLWTGGLFLIAATWIERRRLSWRWLLIGLLFSGLLFSANLARIGVLIVVGQVAGWRLAAEMLHVPLGVLGFLLACTVAVLLLRRLPSIAADGADEPSPSIPHRSPAWLAPTLLAALLVMNLLYTPYPAAPPAQASAAWRFPAGLTTQPLELRPGELDWLFRDGAEAVERVRFDWRGISGSMLLVTSTTRRAHHYPERCFEAYGLTVEGTSAHLVEPGRSIRLLSLSDRQSDRQLSAAYWFQSATRSTDDYGTRFWSDMSLTPERWVLVTILFDTQQNSHTPEMQAFYTALHESVRSNLGGSP